MGSGRTRFFHISPATAVFFAVLWIIDHSAASVMALFAMAIHEAGHLAAAKCCRIQVTGMAIYPFGAEIRVKNAALLSDSRQLILYGSGIAANLVAAVTAAALLSAQGGWLGAPRGLLDGFGQKADLCGLIWLFLLCNLGTATVNLLPISGLDGGSMLTVLLCRLSDPNRAARIMGGVSFFLIAAIWLGGCYGLFVYGSFSPLLFGIFLFARLFL